MTLPEPPETLSEGGRNLWLALAVDGMPESNVAILTEACRARDRLDQFDRLLSGEIETWVDLVSRYEGADPRIVVDDAMAKANSTAALMKNLLSALPAQKAAKSKGTPLDELKQRRTEKSRPPSKARASRQ